MRIRPGWAAAILGVPVPELAGVADNGDAWGSAPARRLEEALAAAATPAQCRMILTSAVGRRLADSGGPRAAVLTAVQRFRAWLAAGGQRRRSLGWAAAECGYFDQAHLDRDCVRLAGVTPSALMAAAPSPSTHSEHAEIAVQLELAHLAPVLLPLLPLVAQEEVEDLLS